LGLVWAEREIADLSGVGGKDIERV
jgi:hypothetical protein